MIIKFEFNENHLRYLLSRISERVEAYVQERAKCGFQEKQTNQKKHKKQMMSVVIRSRPRYDIEPSSFRHQFSCVQKLSLLGTLLQRLQSRLRGFCHRITLDRCNALIMQRSGSADYGRNCSHESTPNWDLQVKICPFPYRPAVFSSCCRPHERTPRGEDELQPASGIYCPVPSTRSPLNLASTLVRFVLQFRRHSRAGPCRDSEGAF
jgi:hypothetical protein